MSRALGKPSPAAGSGGGWLDLALRNTVRSPARSVQLLAVSALATLLAGGAGAVAHALGHGLVGAGDPEVVLVLALSAEGSPERSLLTAEVPVLISAVSGLAMVAGQPAVSAEIVHHAGLQLDGRAPRQAQLRGVTPIAWSLHGSARLLDGRLPGSGEVLVGDQVAHALGLSAPEVAIGAQVRIDGQDLTISGIFTAPGSPVAAEWWLPYQDLAAMSRRDGPSVVRARLASPSAAAAIDYLTVRRSDLELVAQRETEHYSALAAVHRPLRLVAYTAAAIAILAAGIGALSTLAAALAGRAAELATLRAIGVGSWRLLGLLLTESLVLGLAGALPGLVLALLLLDQASLPLASGVVPLAVDGPALLLAAAIGLGLLPLATLLAGIPLLRQPLPLALRSA